MCWNPKPSSTFEIVSGSRNSSSYEKSKRKERGSEDVKNPLPTRGIEGGACRAPLVLPFDEQSLSLTPNACWLMEIRCVVRRIFAICGVWI